MIDVLIGTRSHELIRTNATNVTASSFTEPVPTITQPSGDGVIALGDGGMVTASALKMVFFGVGSDSNTFLANVYGWEFQKSLAGNTGLWVPTLLASFSTITLDTAQPGVNGSDVPAADSFATAITLVTGNAGVSVEVVSPGHSTHEIAHAVVDTKGARFIEVRFSTGGSATSCNALAKRM